MSSPPLILIVDDPDCRNLLSLQLRLCGYHVMAADSAASALLLSRTNRFDLYIVEPRLDNGLFLTRRLPEIGLRAPILYFSAVHMADEQLRDLRIQGHDFLLKPVELTGVRQAVAELLGFGGESSLEFLDT